MNSNIYMAGPSITELEINTVLDMMKTGWYEHPYDYVEKFQKEFAEYHNRKYALMTPNCTSAIHLLLIALGVGEGDEVIVPDCTWIASAAPVTYQKAVPVFCDIDRRNWCLDAEKLEQLITERTKAIIMVDLFGNMPNIEKIEEISTKYGIPIIEDAAEALGSEYKGVKAGKYGIGSVFSFHRTKTLTTGEGGMLLTDDDELYEKCAIYRDHGRRKDGPTYYNYEIGYKYMPSNLAAAIGYAQFQRIEDLLKIKRDILKRYKANFVKYQGIQLNDEPDYVVNGCWSPAIVFDKKYGLEKADIIKRMEKQGYPCRPFFYPLSSLPAFEKYVQGRDYVKRNVNAYDLSNRGINPPCAMNLTNEQIDEYCEALLKIVRNED